MRKIRFALCVAFVLLGSCILSAVGVVSARAYTETKEYVSRLLLSPSVVARVKDGESFTSLLAAKNKSGSVILRVEQSGLAAEDGTVVGTIAQTFAALAESGILPVVELDSLLQVQTLTAAAEENDLRDFAVMSNSVSIMKRVKESMPQARAIIDFSSEEGYTDSYEYIRDVREAGGNVVVLSEKQADRDTVYYLQGMMTTVWVRAEQESRFGFASAISTGAYGIIAADCETLFSVFDAYPVYALPRGYYVAGHRGLPYTENENSLESCIAAFEAGATHLEIDVQTTADRKLVVMHDATLDKTTDGTGAISKMTLEEIRRFKIVKSSDWEGSGNKLTIPTLGEIFEYFHGKDVVIIVEIKDANPTTCTLIKEEIERYEMQKQTVAISFFDGESSQIEQMHRIMPSLPIATLNQPTRDNFDTLLGRAARWNMTFDPSLQTGYPSFFNSNLKDRGYMAWSWTYKDPSAVQIGITGITHDYANIFSEYTKRLTAPEGLTVKEGEELTGKTFTATKLLYNGNEQSVTAKVFMSEKVQGGYRAILVAEEKDDTYYSKVNLFTQPVFIAEKTEAENPSAPPSKKNDTALIIGLSCGAVILAGGIALAIVLLKKKKTAKNR
ncbi:MAG: hypothetical protein HFE47_00165 [Clostridia bacterium]|nr:hypothetical protein [Clostridia bacterium]